VTLIVAALAWWGVVKGAAGAPTRLAWEVLRHDTPPVMWVDTTHAVRLLVHNPSTQEWSEAGGDHLSYHWRRLDGGVEVRDGMRSRFDAPVGPGQTVEVTARVQAPPRGGRWVLEWEMVREQVAWFGAPAGSPPLQVRVWVVRRSVVLQALLVLVTLGLVLVARRRESWLRPGGVPLAEVLPVAWVWLALVLLSVSFAELARRQLWEGAGMLVASSAALLALQVALLPARWRPLGASVLVGFLSLVAVSDLAYLRFFGTIVPVVAAAAAHQVGQIEGSIAALLRGTDLWLGVTALAGIGLAAAWPRPGAAAPAHRRAAFAATLLTCLAGAMPAGVTLVRGIRDKAFADQLFSQEMLVGQWGVLNVHLFDVARTGREWMSAGHPSKSTVDEAVAYFRTRTGAPPASSVAAGANIIHIQVESLQGWVVGAKVGGQEVTPFLNRLRGGALYFPNLFDQTGQGRSSDGEFIALNSLHALDRGAVSFRRPHNRFVAIPAVLRAHGYQTLSAHPFERGFWNRAVLHPRYGFSQMLFKRELGSGEVIGWGLADEPFFLRVAEHLQGMPQPFYAFFITLGLHHPFDEFPARHKVLDVGELAGTPLGNYLHAMHYFDASLARLVAELERRGLWANTVLALHGDHESGVPIDAEVLKLMGAPGWDPSIIVRQQKVPFLVRVPSVRLAGERPVAGGQIDIAPTLLDVVGVAPPASFLGRSLLGPDPSFAVLNDGSTVLGERLYVAGGPAIPAGGACFGFPDGSPRQLAECETARARGREELEMARRVVVHDLVPALLRPEEQRLLAGGGQ
jgi:phosphoglycerol transferase MdoB-like AlkP superfamily enzyme